MSVFNRLFQRFILNRASSSDGPSLDKMLAQFDQELANFNTLVQPAPESKPRTPFDSSLPAEELWLSKITPRQMAALLPVMLPLLRAMRHSSSLYDGRFEPTRWETSPAFLAQLEDEARTLGAADLRYVRVPRNAIFRDKGIPYEYAIIFTVAMDEANMATAPSFTAFKEVASGYRNLAEISNRLTALLRHKGYAAYPGTALGGLTDYAYLAELTGLGAIGYHGLLITPGEGACLRINTIYTNITNLPLETENEHLWVRDFCAMCRKCVRQCPVEAIYDEPRPRGDGGMQCIDHAACRDYFSSHFGCGICLAVCPFSEVGYDKVRARFKGNPDAPQFRIPLSLRTVN